MVNEIKVIHTGDLHLGMTFKSLGTKSKIHRRDCQDVFSNIIDLTIREKANALLIAGDLFDTAYPPVEILKRTFAEFKKLYDEGIKVYMIAGSHDYSVSGKSFLDVFRILLINRSSVCKLISEYPTGTIE